jgi:hypothetical protein
LKLDCAGRARDVPSSVDIVRWKWNHLVVSRNEDTIRVCLNGADIQSFDAKPYFSPASDTFFFGGSCNGEGNFEGRLDEIAVFDRSLSEKEIVDLYRAGAP